MPLYEYKCQQCGEQFEVLQKFSDAPLVTHDQCGGPVERLLSAPGFQFKGSGWYVTDYAGKKNGGAPKSESKPAESQPADSKPAESKPAASTSPTDKK